MLPDEVACYESAAISRSRRDTRFTVITVAGFRAAALAASTEYFTNVVTPAFLAGGPSLNSALKWYARSCNSIAGLPSDVSQTVPEGASLVKTADLAVRMLQASTEVAMTVHDLARVESHVMLDTAQPGDALVSTRGEEIECHPGEPVLRDALGVVASLLTGSDSRTAVRSSTKSLLFCLLDTSVGDPELYEGAVDVVSRFVPAPLGDTVVHVASPVPLDP